MKHREIIPTSFISEDWKEIRLNNSATHSILHDIKVQKQAGGFCYQNNEIFQNRFIYWRSADDVLELSEVSLDIDLRFRNLKIVFENSPVMAVHIAETRDKIILLVSTVNNIHRLDIAHPRKMLGVNGEQSENSIFNLVSPESLKDPSTFSTINNMPGQSVPHVAACYFSTANDLAYFAVAHSKHLVVFQMNANGETHISEMKSSQMIPRIFSNLTGAITGRSEVSDGEFSSSIVFDTIGSENVLYSLYRDNTMRMWSLKTGQCLCTLSVEKVDQGGQTNVLRKSIGSSTLCIYSTFSNGCGEFQFYSPSWDNMSKSFSISLATIVTAPQFDLVHFEMNDQKIWALWCNSNGETHISAFSMNSMNNDCWRTAILEGISEKRRTIESQMDAKHAYCYNIFRPGKFSSVTIAKALTMFTRSSNICDTTEPFHILKERVCRAIDEMIQNEAQANNLSEEDYVDVAISFWEKFYSCCEQYHIASHQPIGLFVMDSFDGVCVIKNHLMTILRPCEVIEDMLMSGLVPEYITFEDKLKDDMDNFLRIVSYLEKNMSMDLKIEISNNLFKLISPNDIVQNLISNFTEESESVIAQELIDEIAEQLRRIRDIRGCLSYILNLLKLDSSNLNDEDFVTDLTSHQRQLFTSNYGFSAVTESVRQVSTSRYAMCRNLLIIQHILIDRNSLSCNETEIIRSKHIPDTVLFLQSYYVMVWISEDAFATPRAKTNVIGFNNHRGYNQPSSLLQLFIKNKGLSIALKLYHRTNQSNRTSWSHNLLTVVNFIESFMWSISGPFIFGEWISETQQSLLIEEYVRLLNKWCDYNSCSRQFILANAFLDIGETQKSYDMFIESAKGVLSEPYLMKFVKMPDMETATNKEIIVQYFIKVMRIFEKFELYDLVISIAEIAMGSASKDTQLATLQSIIFNNHIQLKHYDEAYHSLIHNVEHARRKDCLRKLVILLFQEKRFDILIKFPYIGLEQDLQNIVETRARSMPIEENDHYDFLYTYHVNSNNMKKAATAMYEKALRFQYECKTLESLQKRYNSLLACHNILNLVEENYRWIAKPVIDVSGSDDEEMMEAESSEVVVMDILDIRKELYQVEALLNIAKARGINEILNMGPDELVKLLANQRLYANALKLGKTFKLSLAPIFESLTMTCLNSTNPDYQDDTDWLSLNNNSTDLALTINYKEMPWLYLQKLLDTEDAENQYHRNVVKCLLENQAFVPQWLMSFYKLNKPSELLYLFLEFGRLDEASELAIEFVKAFLGYGGEAFGFKYYLRKSLPSFPINTMDLLLHHLKLHGDKDEICKENYSVLKSTIDTYLSKMDTLTLEGMAMQVS